MARRPSRAWRVHVAPPRPRESRHWRLRFYPPAGSGQREARLRTDISLEEDPDGTKAQELAAQKAKELNLPHATAMTLLDVLEGWRDHDGGGQWSESTRRNAASCVRVLRPLLEEQRVVDWSGPALVRLQDELMRQTVRGGRPRKASSCIALLDQLRDAWRWAEARQIVTKPWPTIPKHARLKPRPTEKRPYEPEEVQAVLDDIREHEPHYLALFLALSDSGKRVSELLRVQGRDIDEQGWLRIRREKVHQHTRAYVLPDVLQLLRGTPPDGWAFPSQRRRGQPMSPRTPLFVLKRALRRLGLADEPLDIHSFRRYRVTEHCDPAESIAQGMRVTGHVSQAVFLRYQRRAKDRGIHAALERSRERRGGRATLSHVTHTEASEVLSLADCYALESELEQLAQAAPLLGSWDPTHGFCPDIDAHRLPWLWATELAERLYQAPQALARIASLWEPAVTRG